MDSIHKLWARVMAHPDFVAGAVFTVEDVKDSIANHWEEVTEDAIGMVDTGDIEDAMVEKGWETLDWVVSDMLEREDDA